MSSVRNCPTCGGVGKHWDDRQILWLTCGVCSGKGYLSIPDVSLEEWPEIKEGEFNPQVEKWGKDFNRRDQ